MRVLNEEAVQHLGISERIIDATAREEQRELERREHAYRGDRESARIEGQHIVLVDDGLATGASMRAAVRALRQQHPAAITVAVPIGSRDTCDQFRNEVEEVICGETPEPFFAVGTWYANFMQTTDEEVRQLLDRAAHERRVRRVKQEKAFTS